MDHNYTVEKCKDALSATTTLVAGAKTGERRQWIHRESFWEEQLRFAEKREKVINDA